MLLKVTICRMDSVERRITPASNAAVESKRHKAGGNFAVAVAFCICLLGIQVEIMLKVHTKSLRIYKEQKYGCYCLRPMPWLRPAKHRLYYAFSFSSLWSEWLSCASANKTSSPNISAISSSDLPRVEKCQDTHLSQGLTGSVPLVSGKKSAMMTKSMAFRQMKRR